MNHVREPDRDEEGQLLPTRVPVCHNCGIELVEKPARIAQGLGEVAAVLTTAEK